MNRRSSLRLSLVALGVLTVLGALSASTPEVRHKQVDDQTLQELLKLHHREQETVRLVLVPASVTDARGRIVTGLDEEDFRLFADHRPKDIAFFASEEKEPMAVAFLLDLSGSMRYGGKLERAKDAIRYFVERLGPQDSMALIGFTDEQVAWVTDFTKDRAEFLQRLEVQRGYGQTALHDAIAAAPTLVDERAPARSAIVLLTDGEENTSEMSLRQAIQSARRVNVPVYAINLPSVDPENLPKDNEDQRLQLLREVAEETGGRVFSAHGDEQLQQALSTIGTELRFQYLIGFYPEASDGEFHPIRVEVADGRLRVRARTGYFSTP